MRNSTIFHQEGVLQLPRRLFSELQMKILLDIFPCHRDEMGPIIPSIVSQHRVYMSNKNI